MEDTEIITPITKLNPNFTHRSFRTSHGFVHVVTHPNMPDAVGVEFEPSREGLKFQHFSLSHAEANELRRLLGEAVDV